MPQKQDLSYKVYEIVGWADGFSFDIPCNSEEDGIKKFDKKFEALLKENRRVWYISLFEFTHLKELVGKDWIPKCIGFREIKYDGTYEFYYNLHEAEQDKKVQRIIGETGAKKA